MPDMCVHVVASGRSATCGWQVGHLWQMWQAWHLWPVWLVALWERQGATMSMTHVSVCDMCAGCMHVPTCVAHFTPTPSFCSMRPMHYLTGTKDKNGRDKIETFPAENGDFRVMAADYMCTNLVLGFFG